MATKNRGLAWSIAETQLLIDLWSENNVLNVLDGTTRNAAVYEKFSKQLEKRGFHRTTAQIRDRMKRLKRDYKEVVDNNKGGAGRKSCHFFYELDRIFGNGSFSNAVIDDNNSPNLPVNVCQAELGKCVASDEEDEMQRVYSSRQNSPNEVVYVNGPRRVVDEGQFRPAAKRRYRKGPRIEEVVNRERGGAENSGVEVGDVVRLEVEKLLLEMEKLREEIGRVREERGKLALEKEVLMLQRRRLIREENVEKMRTRQVGFGRDEQAASLSQEMEDLGTTSMAVSWRGDAVNGGPAVDDLGHLNEEVNAWENNNESTPQACMGNSENLNKGLEGQRERQEIGKYPSVQGYSGKRMFKQPSLDGMGYTEKRQKIPSELRLVEGLEEGHSSSADGTSGLIISQVESIGPGEPLCGFLNHCNQCGHAISCTGLLQVERENE